MATHNVTSTLLQNWTIVGFEERWHVVPGHRQPGGTCWYCGTAIAYCVRIRHTQTGQREIIGSDCAERVGMDREQLRMRRSQYYRDRRAEQSAAAEVTRAAECGEHGTLTRFESGCSCRSCCGAAPHGTPTRWQAGCQCIECVEGVLADDPDSYWIDEEYPVIVELATGRIADAEVVQGTYGSQWKVRTAHGSVYLRMFPARRTTHSKKGYVEAATPMLVTGQRGWNRGRQPWHRPCLPLGEPLVDIWGEPIPHPVTNTGDGNA